MTSSHAAQETRSEWCWYRIYIYNALPTDRKEYEYQGLVLDHAGTIFIGQRAFVFGDPIDYEYCGLHAYRERNSSRVRIVNAAGEEFFLQYEYRNGLFGLTLRSIWFRMVPRVIPTIEAEPFSWTAFFAPLRKRFGDIWNDFNGR